VPPLPSKETDDTTDTAETTTPTDPVPADTVEPAKKGCRSSLSVGLLSALLLAAALTLGKKHDRQ
jgi:uncharacterized protein HemX